MGLRHSTLQKKLVDKPENATEDFKEGEWRKGEQLQDLEKHEATNVDFKGAKEQRHFKRLCK